MAEFRIEGADEIISKLKKLEQKPARNAMRRALRKGANVIKKAAQARAKRFDDPATRAAIHENISVASGGIRREREEGGPIMRVGIRGGAQTGAKQVFSDTKKNRKAGVAGQEFSVAHWRFLEFGTSEMAAQPFMRPAANEKAGAAFDATVTAMQTELDKELAKI